MTNPNTLPDPLELAETLALHDGDLETALECYGLPMDLDDPAIAGLVEEARNLERAADSAAAALRFPADRADAAIRRLEADGLLRVVEVDR